MDPVAVLGAVGSVLTLAQITYDLSREILRISRSAGAAREDIKTFSLALNAFHGVLTIAHATLKRHCIDQQESTVLSNAETRSALKYVTKYSKNIMERIEQLHPELRTMCNSITFRMRWRWGTKQPQVVCLRTEIECVKSSIYSLLLTVNCELVCKSNGSQAEM